MMSEKVAIVMPVHNGQSFLAEAIESILAQTHENFLLIAIDDGSTDKSSEILAQYAANDTRIEIITQENQGIGATKNRGLCHAKTEWVFFIDQDDIMFPNRIERQLEFIRRHPEIRVCSCLATYIDEKGRMFGTTSNSVPTPDDGEAHIRRGEPIGILQPGAVLHRETITSIGGYRNQFSPADDIDLWTRVAEQGHLIMSQNEVLMKYRIHDKSITTSNFQKGYMQVQWIRECMQARRSGEREPDWDSFLAARKADPLWVRANHWRKMISKDLYRQAGRAILTKQRGQGMFKFILATVLRPTYTLPRMMVQVFGRK
jgi:glycosyltransferase involved in cell wall biosynthesis